MTKDLHGIGRGIEGHPRSGALRIAHPTRRKTDDFSYICVVEWSSSEIGTLFAVVMFPSLRPCMNVSLGRLPLSEYISQVEFHRFRAKFIELHAKNLSYAIH